MSLNVFNTTSFLQTAGYMGLFLVIFAETGTFFGLILPGESLLFTAGFLSSLGYFDIGVVIAITFVAAVLADSSGYAIGKKYGVKIFRKKDSLLFDESYIKKAEHFYRKHGGKTILLARFLPYLRMAAPMLAGVGSMRYRVFLAYNIVGALAWSVGVGLLGFYVGKAIPNADQYVLLAVAIIVVISFLPLLAAVFRSKKQRAKLSMLFKHK